MSDAPAPRIVSFAAPPTEAGRAALGALVLPRLAAFAGSAQVTDRDDGDVWSFSPPHERALAQAFGWHGGEGRLPFAARAAAADGIEVGDLAWGRVTPVHWLLGTDQVSLIDPAGLMLDEAAARTLFEAVRPLFTSEGFAFEWGAPMRWYVAHESLADLACASIDRVIGRSVDHWLVEGMAGPQARLLRRLHNEVQMLLHTHPVNAERESRGLLPVNSFWLDGCGVAQPVVAEPQLDERLRAAALAEDWAAWAKAFEQIDAGFDAADGTPLVLAGERGWVRLDAVPRPWWRGLADRVTHAMGPRRRPLHDLLETL